MENLLLKNAPLKILVPINTIPRMLNPILINFVKNTKSEIIFFHVIPGFWKKLLIKNESENLYSDKINQWAEKNIKNKKTFKVHIESGIITDKIVEFSEKKKCNLIFFDMRNSEKNNDEHNKLIQQVVRYSKKTIFVSKQKKISKILCAVDGSPSSRKALNSAIQFCKILSCKLTVLHIFPPIDFNPIGLDEHIVRKFNKDFEQKRQAQMDAFLKKSEFKNLKKIYLKGSPASTILDYSEDNKINLIVMGAKGQSLMHDIFVGSTVERVLPYARCSLLIVR